jgi:hypothetical protein
MKVKKIMFFLRQKKNLSIRRSNKFILHSPIDMNIIDVINYIQFSIKINFRVYPVSKKSIKHYCLNNSNVVKLVKTTNFILIKELNEFLFVTFFESFRNFSIVKKVSKYDFKTYKNDYMIYFNYY